jgi:DNA polymerase V
MKPVIHCPLKTSTKRDVPLISFAEIADILSSTSDYKENLLNLNTYAVNDDSITCFVEAVDNSMIGAGIFPGTLLVVDKSLEAQDGDIVVGFLEGECIVNWLRYEYGKVFLCPENEDHPTYEVDNEDFQVLGVVTGWLHKLKRY